MVKQCIMIQVSVRLLPNKIQKKSQVCLGFAWVLPFFPVLVHRKSLAVSNRKIQTKRFA